MKKQGETHTPSRVHQSETPITSIPSPALAESRPKGVLDRSHPGHVTRGAAEPRTNPVDEAPSGGRPNDDKKR